MIKKRVLLVGNTNGLPGVKVDLEKYKTFFKSPFGGQWMDHEIIEYVNPTKEALLTDISTLRALSLDYVITVFSGHGGYERETVFELNIEGETVSENDLASLATRQLAIYDCCRVQTAMVSEGLKAQMRSKFQSTVNTRERYDARIKEASPQHIRLYACAIGECAYDTTDGGVYSKNLLGEATRFHGDYKLVGEAHEHAAVLTNRAFKEQNPQAELPRLLSRQQLIFSIKP